MFKINFHSLCFLAVIFLNNPSVLSFSSSPPSTTQSERSLFPDIFPQAGNNNSTTPLFPIDSSVTPKPYNCLLNSSTNTFIPPLMLAGCAHNMSTDTFNLNYFSLPIIDDSEDFNNASANTNNKASSLIPNDSIPNNTTNTSAHTVVPRTKQVAHTNQNKDHALSEKHKKEKRTKTYTCPTCNKILASRGSFNYHIKTHDPNRKRPYQCHICPKSFIKKDALKKHIDRHKNAKTFRCDFCSKHFTTKYEKTRHHRTHTGEKPFKCDICQKKLSSKAALEGHLNRHKNKKPHKCNRCTKAYNTREGLKHHLKTHNRPKAYSCHYCGADFTFKTKYDNHMRYEEGEDEDCKCHRCKKVYTNKYRLREHNKRIHPQINS